MKIQTTHFSKNAFIAKEASYPHKTQRLIHVQYNTTIFMIIMHHIQGYIWFPFDHVDSVSFLVFGTFSTLISLSYNTHRQTSQHHHDE